jgi:hypothetical protein
VQRVRQRVVDQLDVRRGDNVSVGVKHVLKPQSRREGHRPVALPRGHRYQPVSCDSRRRDDGSLSNASSPQYADPERFGVRWRLRTSAWSGRWPAHSALRGSQPPWRLAVGLRSALSS